MNQGEALRRMQQPLAIPEEPLDTVGVQTPQMLGVSSQSPGAQMAAMQAHSAEMQQGQEDYLRRYVGPISQGAVGMDVVNYNPRPVEERQIPSGGSFAARYVPKDDLIDLAKTGKDVQGMELAHEVGHRAGISIGLTENANYLLDMYNARELRDNTAEYASVKKLEDYMAENPREMSEVGANTGIGDKARGYYYAAKAPNKELLNLVNSVNRTGSNFFKDKEGPPAKAFWGQTLNRNSFE